MTEPVEWHRSVPAHRDGGFVEYTFTPPGDEGKKAVTEPRPVTALHLGNCEICTRSAARFHPARLYLLGVRTADTKDGAVHENYHYLCEDCLKLFNAPKWTALSKKLRKSEKPIAPSDGPQTRVKR